MLLYFKPHVDCDCEDHLVDLGEIAKVLARTVAWSPHFSKYSLITVDGNSPDAPPLQFADCLRGHCFDFH